MKYVVKVTAQDGTVWYLDILGLLSTFEKAYGYDNREDADYDGYLTVLKYIEHNPTITIVEM